MFTHSIGEYEDSLTKDKNTISLLSVKYRYSGGTGYGHNFSIYNFRTGKEINLPTYSESNHPSRIPLYILRLPPGVYAIVHHSVDVGTYDAKRILTHQLPLANAPWFEVKQGKNLYYGALLFDLDQNQINALREKEKVDELLIEMKKEISYAEGSFIFDKQTKEILKKKYSLKGVE